MIPEHIESFVKEVSELAAKKNISIDEWKGILVTFVASYANEFTEDAASFIKDFFEKVVKLSSVAKMVHVNTKKVKK